LYFLCFPNVGFGNVETNPYYADDVFICDEGSFSFFLSREILTQRPYTLLGLFLSPERRTNTPAPRRKTHLSFQTFPQLPLLSLPFFSLTSLAPLENDNALSPSPAFG